MAQAIANRYPYPAEAIPAQHSTTDVLESDVATTIHNLQTLSQALALQTTTHPVSTDNVATSATATATSTSVIEIILSHLLESWIVRACGDSTHVEPVLRRLALLET